jgi:pimeloyl-ACP methyl ester carboxylesterase
VKPKNSRLAALGLVLMSGCTASPMLKYSLNVPAQTMSVLDTPEVRDGRARFREVFCSTLREHPDRKQRGCEELLHRLADEAPSAPQPGTPPIPDLRLRLVFVTGLFNDCASVVALPFETAVPRLRSLGYRAEILTVSGRSSSSFNAARIAEFVSQTQDGDQRLVLVGYSKGAVDILEFMVAYPELASRVSAVVSVAGAINGSPVADIAASFYRRLFKDVSLPGCSPGDDEALTSLGRPARFNWLVAHRLPQSARYFSLVSFTRTDSVSGPLRPFAAALAEIDPRNDGQLLFYDQVIPGATLLGYVNADHWSIAVPIEEKRPVLATLVTGHNWFPRDALVEAVALYLSEQLAMEQGTR